MTTLLTIAVAVLSALLALYMFAALIMAFMNERQRFQRFAQSSCAGQAWRHLFPTVPKDDIRRFLDLVYAEFGPNCLSRRMNRRLRLTLAPSERLLDLYHLMYPKGSYFNVDQMELENLAMYVEEDYDIDLAEHWRDDITLGEIFALTREG